MASQPAPQNTDVVKRANRLKMAVVNAVANDEPERLLGLMRQISSLHPTADDLSRTGLGFFVADQSCWASGGPVALALPMKVTTAWKKAVKGSKSARCL